MADMKTLTIGDKTYNVHDETARSAASGAATAAANAQGTADTAKSNASTAQSRADAAYALAEANKVTVDSALSSTSTNPVQNKVINTALAGKAASSHNQAASTITAGTFAGQVVANSSGQTYSTYVPCGRSTLTPSHVLK